MPEPLKKSENKIDEDKNDFMINTQNPSAIEKERNIIKNGKICQLIDDVPVYKRKKTKA